MLAIGLVVVAALASVAAGSSTKLKPAQLKATPLKPTSSFEGDKSLTGRIAQTDPTLLGRSDSSPVNVFIKYDFDSTASYRGGVNGLAATSPLATGRKLRDNRGAAAAYDAYIGDKASRISSAVRSAASGVSIRDTFKTVYGGVEARVPANEISKILSVPGVVAVQKDAVQHPLDATGVEPQFIGASSVWPQLGGETKAGDGVVVGVIDSGVWPESPFFIDHGLSAPAGSYQCQFGTSGAPGDAAFPCNNKLIGAYAFTDTYMAVVGAGADEFCNSSTGVCSARDSEGHGTHTASTAVGDEVDSAPLFGVDRGPISGMAPGAKLIAYRVCLAEGCFNSDTVQAVQQAITDGVDVINFSVSGGNDPYTDPVELAFLDAFNAGISVNASAGNEGPGPATVAHNSPWVTTVAASTSNRFFTSTLHLHSSDTSVLDLQGVTIMPGISTPTPVVLAETLVGEDALCQSPLAPGEATGVIVACQRGVNARVDKGYNVAQGGAAGMILYNPIKQDVETDNHWLPAIHIDGPSTTFLSFMTKPNVTATFTGGTPSPTQGDVMASFSSRGPAPDFVKPDITAPGIQVLAGMTAQPTGITSGPPGELFQAIAGTSMSGPHSAGASALVKAAHPNWTPAEIKSALMTSAAQGAVKEDGTTPVDPFDAGAGSLRVDKAVNPTVVFDENYADYVASASDKLGRINLNLPSVDAPTMPGTVFTTRRAKNVTDRTQVLRPQVSAPAGASITVNGGRDITVPRNGSAKFSIVISAPSLANGQYFGRITLVPRSSGYNPVTMPVAFFKQQGHVQLVNSCSPTTFQRRTGHTHCTVAAQNFDASPANVKLVVQGVSRHGVLLYSHIVAPSGTLRTPLGFAWKGQLAPAQAPAITGIAPTTTAIGGYIPLSFFGPPVGGFGDETISNFSVPAFKYGQETYTSIGVDSNGYVVVGGGTTADNNCCTITPFPNSAKPNNVLAPFWTDLNADPSVVGADGGVYVNVLTDGTTSWIVVDWENVPTFGTTNYQAFEVWIETAATGEGITYEYGSVADGGASTGLGVGAENRDGSSGVNLSGLPVAGTEYGITTTGPTPGGSVSIDYDASSPFVGTLQSAASLTSDITPGVTQQVQQLTVTP